MELAITVACLWILSLYITIKALIVACRAMELARRTESRSNNVLDVLLAASRRQGREEGFQAGRLRERLYWKQILGYREGDNGGTPPADPGQSHS